MHHLFHPKCVRNVTIFDKVFLRKMIFLSFRYFLVNIHVNPVREGANLLVQVTSLHCSEYFITVFKFSPKMGIVLSLFRTRVEPFHVEVEPLEMKMKGINMFPMMHFMMTSMSDSRRRNAVTKQVMTLYRIGQYNKTCNLCVECSYTWQSCPSRPVRPDWEDSLHNRGDQTK